MWQPANEASYAYLLGMYLGDGCLYANPRGGVQVRICLDTRHPAVIDDCWAAMVLSMFSRPVSVRPRSGCAAVHVQSAGKRWLDAFPQHGPGRKHERPIVLTQWQWEIVGRHRGDFVRGLIHSDGCRTINRFSTRLPSGRLVEYAYPRYFFSNLSPDIRDLFSEACDALGVRWSRSSSRNISVSHRRSVAVLDEIGCAKA